MSRYRFGTRRISNRLMFLSLISLWGYCPVQYDFISFYFFGYACRLHLVILDTVTQVAIVFDLGNGHIWFKYFQRNSGKLPFIFSLLFLWMQRWVKLVRSSMIKWIKRLIRWESGFYDSISIDKWDHRRQSTVILLVATPKSCRPFAVPYRYKLPVYDFRGHWSHVNCLLGVHSRCRHWSRLSKMIASNGYPSNGGVIRGPSAIISSAFNASHQHLMSVMIREHSPDRGRNSTLQWGLSQII